MDNLGSGETGEGEHKKSPESERGRRESQQNFLSSSSLPLPRLLPSPSFSRRDFFYTTSSSPPLLVETRRGKGREGEGEKRRGNDTEKKEEEERGGN